MPRADAAPRAPPAADAQTAPLHPVLPLPHLAPLTSARSYDTLLCSDAEAAAKGLRPEQVYTSPNGFKFVKKSVAEGILPMIETELLAARKRAKQQMKDATNAMDRSVFDGKQQV